MLITTIDQFRILYAQIERRVTCTFVSISLYGFWFMVKSIFGSYIFICGVRIVAYMGIMTQHPLPTFSIAEFSAFSIKDQIPFYNNASLPVWKCQTRLILNFHY